MSGPEIVQAAIKAGLIAHSPKYRPVTRNVTPPPIVRARVVKDPPLPPPPEVVHRDKRGQHVRSAALNATIAARRAVGFRKYVIHQRDLFL